MANVPLEIVIAEVPLSRPWMNERKEEDAQNDESFLNNLYFDKNTEVNEDENHANQYTQIMDGFNAFLKEANESTHSGKACNTKEEVKIWWEKRYKLDKRLKGYLEQIETDILGFFACLFIPRFRHKQSKKLVHSSCDALVTAINEYLLKKTNNTYRVTCYTQHMMRSSKMILFEKLLQWMIIGHAEHTVDDEDVKHGLSYVFGVNDSYLLNKLLDTVKQHIITIHKKFIANCKMNVHDFDPLILCIGDTLSHLPWENIPILKALRVLEYNAYKRDNAVRLDYYYILNPKGDLKKTEGRFNRLLNEDWNGIKSQIPSVEQFRDGLERNDVFLYVGHNGGEEFVSCWKLQTFDIKAITFLMGCSSGLLKKKGMYQSNGIANYYMIGACPIVVANLWDVTDKDIDQFSCQMLRKCVLKQQSIVDIPKAVNVSRSVCKLKYLNGAAPICYGIPFHLFTGIYV